MATSAILSLRPLIVPISMGAVWQVRHAAPASALFTPSTTTQTVDGLARGGLSVGTVFIVYQMSQSPVPAGSWAANRQSILMVGMIAAAAAFASGNGNPVLGYVVLGLCWLEGLGTMTREQRWTGMKWVIQIGLLAWAGHALGLDVGFMAAFVEG